MASPQNAGLIGALRSTVERIRKYQGRNLLEEDTKASLIEPVLEALGWNIREPDEVRREFKVTTKDTPVDYALAILRQPKLFVEAKALGAVLSDSRWVAQVLGYATVAGVEWCVLTDGDEYRFYNASAPVHADEKLFRKVRLSESGETEAAKVLSLISRGNMEGDLLETVWKMHFVDRSVKQVLREMLETPDKGLIRLIRKKASKLNPKDVAQSIRRLDVRIESPTLAGPPAITGGTPPPKPKIRRKKPGASQRVDFGVSLADLISAGLLSAPLRLFREYKGNLVEATLLPEGTVQFEGTTYDSCSTAAESARATITGRKMNTNGWSFWQYLGAGNQKSTLADARQRFIAMKRASAGK
jgi:predicted type IV restriction endonuclease